MFFSGVAIGQTSSVKAALISPAPGGTLGSIATFTWTAGTGVTQYALWLGTAPGTYNIYNSGHITGTSVTVTNLPTNGQTIYAQLYSYMDGGWPWATYTYTEGIPTPAAIASPAPGSVLGSSASFSWSAGVSATQYSLTLGTTGVGSSNLYSSGVVTATSATVTGIPIDGTTVYAQLGSYIGGAWQFANYTYTETAPVKAALISPAPGGTLGSSATFTWSAGTGVTQYALWLSTTPGSYNIYNSGHITGTSVTVTNLPTNGAPIYAQLYSYMDGGWPWTVYSFTEGGAAPVLSALSCGNTSMTEPGADACTVTLNAAAPVGGLIVNLSSNNTAVTVPATVTVPSGATTAAFTAAVASVATAQSAKVTASAGSATETLVLQLNANMPTLTVSTSSSPSTYGSSITFTATISNAVTGTVTFYDSGTAIGTGAINGTIATLTTSSLHAGSQSITANWPGNTSYGAVTSSPITQVVNKASPTITWSTPASMVYGTALSGTQLDASSTISGVFVYSPAAGAVLAVGSQTLSVTFTPTDSTDYATATKAVTLTVNQGTSVLSINAASIAFGSTNINTPLTQPVTLTSTGTAAVTVNSAVVTGAGFAVSGSTLPTTLTPGQTVTLSVEFDPATAGAATGQLTVKSTSSTNGTAVIGLTGTGLAVAYVVDLSWDAPSASEVPVAGYAIYRAPSGSSTYQLLNSSIDAETTYVDTTVQSGLSYVYYVESVSATGVQSAPSAPYDVTVH
ncbi:MAG: Ig-like domain repeat protein [Terracidiphilus sp.]